MAASRPPNRFKARRPAVRAACRTRAHAEAEHVDVSVPSFLPPLAMSTAPAEMTTWWRFRPAGVRAIEYRRTLVEVPGRVPGLQGMTRIDHLQLGRRRRLLFW
jgi:hypothetical protein